MVTYPLKSPNHETRESIMEKPVYCVLTAALYEHASLDLATPSYSKARERFESLVKSDPWQTIILEEWFEGEKHTLDIESRS